MRRKETYIVVIILVAIGYFIFNSVPKGYEIRETAVTKVVDGDTIVIEGGQRVRLLNMDTRERGENCYSEAKKRLEELVLLKNVTLETDRENKDRYGRLLRHVYVEGISANLEMVREGLAVAYIIEPNTRHAEEFREAEELARQEGGCVWEKLP